MGKKLQSAPMHERAIEELKCQADKQFDPRVVEVFCQVMERKEGHPQQAPPVGDSDRDADTQPPA